MREGAGPVRACYVLLEYPVLTQTFVSDEIQAVRDAGAEVFVVSLDTRSGPADVNLAARRLRSPALLGRLARLLVRSGGARRALLRGPFGVRYRMKLLAAAEEARRWGAHAVHAHFAYRSADAAEVIGAALGTGHTVTCHAHDIFVNHEHLERRLAAARRVVTVCEYNRRHLLERHGHVLAGDVAVIPCSVRVPDRLPDPSERATGAPPVVVAVGRLVPKKGIDVLVRAIAEMSCDAELVVVGDGPERRALERLAEASGVAHRVRFAGALGHAETLEQVSSADLLCMPFRVAADGDRDSMPVVVKEAMAAGRPVVSTSTVGVPEMVQDGITGLLVPPDDVSALAGALDALVADPARRVEMGRAGWEVAAERFDLRGQASAVLEVLAS